MRCPSRVMEGNSRSSKSCTTCSCSRDRCSRKKRSVSGAGRKMTKPELPSMIIVSPERMRVVRSRKPATAGIFKLRAMMAVCEVQPPAFVAKPCTFSVLSSAAIEGIKSSAIKIASSEKLLNPRGCVPERILIIRLETSSRSVPRARIYSSVICA